MKFVLKFVVGEVLWAVALLLIGFYVGRQA